MSDKKEKTNIFAKIGGWFANIGKKIAKAFTNMVSELKKVTWPTRDKLVRYSAIVILFIVFMMVVVGLLDLGATQLVKLLSNLKG